MSDAPPGLATGILQAHHRMQASTATASKPLHAHLPSKLPLLGIAYSRLLEEGVPESDTSARSPGERCRANSRGCDGALLQVQLQRSIRLRTPESRISRDTFAQGRGFAPVAGRASAPHSPRAVLKDTAIWRRGRSGSRGCSGRSRAGCGCGRRRGSPCNSSRCIAKSRRG